MGSRGGAGQKRVVRRYWVSWVQPTDDHRPLSFPPNEAIRGWWCTGESDEGSILCAVVDAKSEDHAAKMIAKEWPESIANPWRFVEQMHSGWFPPSDRFRLSAWMKPRMVASCLLLLFAWCSTAFGQIDVPASVRFDKPIVATVKSGAPEGSELKLRWSASPDLSLVQVGEAVHIWGPAGKHKLACSVVWLQFEVVDVGGRPVKSLVAWDMISHEREFEITGSTPPPVPPPGPPPGPVPTPDVPSDEFGDIGRRVATWAASLPPEHRRHAPALATIYETVASMYAAGALADADAATEKTRELRDERIPDVATQTAWRAAVLAQVNEDIKSRWDGMDRQQYAAYLRCISVGLKGVKQ